MSVFAFDKNIQHQIKKVINYANLNVYSLDDLLDMRNGQMDVPAQKPEHLVLVPMGRWICYYLVDHPEHGRCNYFSIHPDASGQIPDRPVVEHILKEFGIESPLLDKHIKIDEMGRVTNIILPIAL